LTIILAIVGIVIAALGSWYTYLAYKRSSKNENSREENLKPISSNLPTKLLSYIWYYPIKGGSKASWAVKESFVLRGRLHDAKEKPGLGVAIVTTELAIDAFGNVADSRIDGCISWALSQCMKEAPFLLTAEVGDQRTASIVRKPDFRHSLAFAIILARTRKLSNHLDEYLDLVLNTQNADGGWPPGEGITVSEVFTVLYAIELLGLCISDNRLSEEIRRRCTASLDLAARWLIASVGDNGLWSSGVLKEFTWDDIVTTAWVIHRLSPAEGISVPGWHECLSHATSRMASKTVNTDTWNGTSEIQRFRVEARVAASISVVLSCKLLDSASRDLSEIYLNDWRIRSLSYASILHDDEMDVATATFVLQALVSRKGIRELAEEVGLTRACT